MTKKGFVTRGLRRLWLTWPARKDCLKAAYIGHKENPSTGRLAQHYECADCKKHFMAKEIQIDHIKPIAANSEDWNDYVEQLFCSVDNLQALCKHCHANKTRRDAYAAEKRSK